MRKFSVFIVFVFALFIFASCKQQPQVVHHGNCKNVLKTLTITDEDILSLTENIFNSYQDSLKRYIHPTFLDSFYLGNSKGYKADIVISSISDAYIVFEPRDERTINIYCTDLPCQLKCFFNYEMPDGLVVDYLRHRGWTAWMKKDVYDTLVAAYYMDTIIDVSQDNLTKNALPKMFIMENRAIVITQNDRCFTNGDSLKFITGQFSFLFGGLEFLTLNRRAWEIVNLMISIRTEILVQQSPLFARAKANDTLRALATKIISKLFANRFGDHYQLWELERDNKNFQDLALNLGVPISYADSIITDEKSKDKYGTLFWHYSTYWGFSFQWLLPNLFFLITIVTFRLLKKPDLLREILQWIIGALFLFLNGWIFKNKPGGMEIGYWVLPLLTAMSVVILAIYWKIRFK